jgi:hypothetical protein
MCYTDIDTGADRATAEDMCQKAQGIWMTPTIIAGQDVALGFDLEWVQARIGT